MMQTGKTAMVLAALVAVLGAAPRLVVFDLQPVGLAPEDITVATMLLRDRLVETDSFRLVEPPAGEPVTTIDAAAAAARDAGADYGVVGSVARIGDKLLVSWRLVNAATGDVVLSDRATLSKVDEMDATFERIADAIALRRPFTVTGDVRTFTSTEIKRRAALSSVFLTTGYSYLMEHQVPRDPGGMLFTLEAAVSYETPDVLAQGVMGLRRGKNDFQDLYFDLLVHKLFSNHDVTPYIGGGIGVHRLSTGSLDEDGLGLTASAGVILFRSQYFRIVAGAKASAILTDDWGINYLGGFQFGLSSPTVGPGGDLNVPSPCVFGCLGAFFLTGLIVALTT